MGHSNSTTSPHKESWDPEYPSEGNGRVCRLAPNLQHAEDIGLVGSSSRHVQLLDELARIAPIDAEVLLVGETGVGKELYAKFVHQCSGRTAGEFVAVNCGAIPDALFENELFGHTDGAYTDAGSQSQGLVAAAEAGTLFLDEVHQLSMSGQVKLLRLLQEKEYRRLGETRLRRANIRVISATNVNPLEAIKQSLLREDLYYRINVVQKTVPPLRERRKDIVTLATSFLRQYCDEYARHLTIGDDALRLFFAYDWPGNVRQLQNMIRSLVCQSDSAEIGSAVLPVALNHDAVREHVASQISSLISLPFCDAKRLLIEEFEKQYILEMLRMSDGNITKAASLADKPLRSFRRTMHERGIDARCFKPSADDFDDVQRPSKPR